MMGARAWALSSPEHPSGLELYSLAFPTSILPVINSQATEHHQPVGQPISVFSPLRRRRSSESDERVVPPFAGAAIVIGPIVADKAVANGRVPHP